jgi:hypothetical protein
MWVVRALARLKLLLALSASWRYDNPRAGIGQEVVSYGMFQLIMLVRRKSRYDQQN